ncbi:MAG TPA: uridine phosphorylase, partial [bacterium]|nr:uridine phosphorylase [bacterium]
MVNIYHLNINKKQIKNAKLAIIPGDPARVPKIALALDRNSVELAFNREYRTYLSKVGNAYILTTSTGIGGPSATIAIEELAYLGVEKFLRVGTTGSIQKGLKVGDIVITTAAVRLDGASAHYAPLEYPAVADFYITRVLVDTAEKLKLNFKVGITASSDTFYPGQERYDSFSGYVIRRFQGSMKEWQKLNVLNYEMESSAVFTICSALGLKAGCVAGVVVNRT